MDFVADQLADGRKIRTTIIDLLTRECLGIEFGFSLRAEHVVAAMDCLTGDRGLPQRISFDTSKVRKRGLSQAIYIPRSVPRHRAIETARCACGTRGLPQ